MTFISLSILLIMNTNDCWLVAAKKNKHKIGHTNFNKAFGKCAAANN